MKKLIILLLVIAGILFLLFYTLRLYKIDGTSMNYGLIEGDKVLCLRQFSAIQRGDILVFEHPQDPQKRLYVKRCAALPGDKFFQKERSFYLQAEGNSQKTYQMAQSYDLEAVSVDGEYFIKDPYVKYYGVVHNWRLEVPEVLTHLPISTVEAGHYYMLGDYRDNSADSRFFGAVPEKWVYSKVLYVFKEPRRWIELLRIREAD